MSTPPKTPAPDFNQMKYLDLYRENSGGRISTKDEICERWHGMVSRVDDLDKVRKERFLKPTRKS
jgi:hypothetical protein